MMTQKDSPPNFFLLSGYTIYFNIIAFIIFILIGLIASALSFYLKISYLKPIAYIIGFALLFNFTHSYVIHGKCGWKNFMDDVNSGIAGKILIKSSILLFISALISMFISTYLVKNGYITPIQATPFLPISLALVFAIWGTMLPAITGGEDASFGMAAHRAKQVFAYVFFRLLLLGLLMLAAQIGGKMVINVLAPTAVPHASLLSPGVVLAELWSNALGGVQVVMMAVILSQAYLIWKNRLIRSRTLQQD